MAQLVFILSIISITLVFPHQALAWGSITHSAICRAAGGGDEFALGGVAPDMIALHSVTTGDKSFDYAHNYFGGDKSPVFGNTMTRVSNFAFARGWAAHQVEDSVVHGPTGYSNTKPVFPGMPDKYKTSLNHGAVELVVDAIVLDEFYHRSLSLSVPDQSELIHAAAVRFYNDRLPDGARIPRGTILNCHTVANLSYEWDLCMNTSLYLAELMLDENWFPALRRNFNDYRPLFSQSVNLVAGRAAPVIKDNPCAPDFWDQLAALLPAGVAQAASAEPTPNAADAGEPADYYRMLSRISHRATRIGGGRISKTSVRQAVVELERDRRLSDREQVWAAALAGLTDRNTTTFNQVKLRVAETGRRVSRQGAAGGKGRNVLPCIPGAVLFVLAVAVGWRSWRKK
jgi:hypothetical protein